MASNAEKLVIGLRSRGVILSGEDFYIMRDFGQPMMNKGAGECAPTWYLHCDPTIFQRTGRNTGGDPSVEYEGRTEINVEVCSYMPLLWILKHPTEEWDIEWETLGGFRRLNIGVNGLPPTWIK